MTINAPEQSYARRVSRGTFDLNGHRVITADDAHYAALLAIPTAITGAITVERLVWEVDGIAVDSPVGQVGSRLTATAELSLGGGAGFKEGEVPNRD